jgi:hypothetical protein
VKFYWKLEIKSCISLLMVPTTFPHSLEGQNGLEGFKCEASYHLSE